MIKKGLIVSIQGYSQPTIQELAFKVVSAGCVAIRTDKTIVSEVPLIALEKIPSKKYYITTSKEAIKSCSWGQYVAIDSRKGNIDLSLLYAYCHITETKVIADIENIQDVINLLEICQKNKIVFPEYFCTTFSFLTTKKHDFNLIRQIKDICDINVIAEGKIKSLDDVKKAFEIGASNVCIGAEISDIEYLTKKFIEGVTNE